MPGRLGKWGGLGTLGEVTHVVGLPSVAFHVLHGVCHDAEPVLLKHDTGHVSTPYVHMFKTRVREEGSDQ